jgi:hypothetical protein
MFGGAVSELSFTHPQIFHHMLDYLHSKQSESFFSRNNTHPEINATAVESWFKTRKIKESGLSLDPDTYLQIVSFGQVGYADDVPSIVPTPSQILQNSMRSYSDKFVNGAFAVNRINTISPAWMSGANTANNITADGLYECWTYTIGSDGAKHLTRLDENIKDGGATSDLLPMRDTLWTKDMTWTLIRMQGITPNINSSQPSAAAPIAIKYYQTIEAQPVWNGPWNGCSRVSPKPDLAAMQMLMDTFYDMPDAMPVKYNALGAFLPFLASALPHALGFVKDLITGKKEKSTPRTREMPPTTTRKSRSMEPRATRANTNRENELQARLDKLERKFASMSCAPRRKTTNMPSRKRTPRKK